MFPIVRWAARLIGIALLVIGLFPLTPLVWLLVFVKAGPIWPFGVHKFEFWQTQTIGVVLAILGAALVYASFRRRAP